MSHGLQAFINDWDDDPKDVKKAFVGLSDLAATFEGVSVSFVSRPGVTSSLRLEKPGVEQPLRAMVDVIEDEDGRWLSVCFHADVISDPDGLGDLIPGGLSGKDGYCFDMSQGDDAFAAYLAARLAEAAAA